MSMAMTIHCFVIQHFMRSGKVYYSRLSWISEHFNLSLVDLYNVFPLSRETEKKSICVNIKHLNQSWLGARNSMYVVEKGSDLAFRVAVCQTDISKVLSPVY